MGVNRGKVDPFETGEDITGTTARPGAEVVTDDEETTRTEDLTPDAGGDTAEPGAETAGDGKAKPTQQKWEDLAEWAQSEIREGRQKKGRLKTVLDQLEAQGITVDEESGQVIMPERAPAAATADARERVEDSGLPPARKEHYLNQLRVARVSDDPEAGMYDVMLEMATEIASGHSRRAVTQVLSTNERATINSYKQTFRDDQETGDVFKLVERDFDAVVAQTKEEYKKADVPFIVTEQLMGYLRSLAMGQSIPRIRQALASGKTVQRETAARVARETGLAPGSTVTRTDDTQPLSAKDKEIIGKMARGAGQSAEAMEKRLAKGGG